MKISELAQRTGVSPRSIRYYEQQKLLTSGRAENGYREFDDESVNNVNAIQFYFNLGLSTYQIRPLLGCLRASAHSRHEVCDEAIELYESKLTQIDSQIEMMRQIRQRVETHLAYLMSQQASAHNSERNGVNG